MRTRIPRRTVAALATGLLSLGALVAFAAPASAGGNMHVEVNKVVVGTAPPGTTFTVHFDCTAPGPDGDLTFDATGQPVPAFSNFFNDGTLGTTCTISETGTGGAEATTILCADDGVNASCSSDGKSVTFDSPGGFSNNVTFTVVNAYSNALSHLNVSPSPAKPGDTVTVSGAGCTKALFGGPHTTGGTVGVSIGFTPQLNLHTTAAGTSGAWSVEFTVPDVASGEYHVDADCDDPVAYPAAVLAVQVPEPEPEPAPVPAAVAVTPSFTG